MNAYEVGAFPDIPTICLDNGESVPYSQTWSGDISSATSASDFDYDQGYHSPALSVDLSKFDVSTHEAHIGQNPITRFQMDAHAPFVGSEFGSPAGFGVAMKVEYHQQLYVQPHIEPFYRNGSPDGTDSAYSGGGGTFSSAGSDVVQSTPRSAVSPQQSQWTSSYGTSASPVQFSEHTTGGETVNMGLIQQVPDEMVQSPEPEEEYEPEEQAEQYTPYGQPIYAHSGYGSQQVLPVAGHNSFVDSHQPSISPIPFKEEEGEEDDEADDPTFTPRSQGRRRTGSQAGRSLRRPQMSRTHSAPTLGQGHRVSKPKNKKTKNPIDGIRPFPCPLAQYGCASRFNAKNEWKRHISTQHVKTFMWRCDMCPVSPDPLNPNHNDFNRKDLFTQHVKRMHGGESQEGPKSSSKGGAKNTSSISDEDMAGHVLRCQTKLRDTPPHSNCIICPKTFSGPASWEDRIEHIANAHFETDKKADCKGAVAIENWKVDPVLEQWLYEEGLIEKGPGGRWKLGNGEPRRRADQQHTYGY